MDWLSFFIGIATPILERVPSVIEAIRSKAELSDEEKRFLRAAVLAADARVQAVPVREG